MDPTDIARWQFAIITVYHFLFVPLTIGLSAIVAGYETAWVRTRDEQWLRLTKFFGKLFLINFAIGVVTGIVQEFQFGMNWSDYSRFVGDVFGAPLAVEGLLAFFLESTFLGLWIFGWDRLSARLHAACIWLVHIGTLFSAYFILAANSWMQHPVGYTLQPRTGRAEMNDFAAVLFNKVQLVTFPHVVLSAYLTGAAFVVGVAFWQLRPPATAPEDRRLYRLAVRTGAVVALVAGAGRGRLRRHPGQGDDRGPADEDGGRRGAVRRPRTRPPSRCSPSAAWTGREEKFAIKVPGLLSFLATGSSDGEVEGINDLREQYEQTYGQDPGAAYYSPGDYTPNIPVTYWTFRLMIGLGPAGRADRPAGSCGPPGAAGCRSGRLRHGRGRRPAAAAAARQLVRLDLHRGRPSAVGRLRAHDHRARRLPGGEHGRGPHLPDRLHPPVRRARRRRGPLLLPTSAAAPTRAARRRPTDDDASDPDKPLAFAY